MSIIFICALSIIGISFINSMINTQRQVAFNKLNLLYDQIELFVVKNEMRVDGRLKRFLKGMKAYKINHEFADIHVLLITVQNMPAGEFEKGKAEYNKFVSQLPEGFIVLKKRFDQQVMLAIFLSIFRFEFLTFFAYCSFKLLCKSVYHRSTKRINSLWSTIADIFRYESVVISRYTDTEYRYRVAA